MNDIRLLRTLRTLGSNVVPELSEWFKQRESETYYYQHPNLNRSKSEFFDTEGVVYAYDHDTIHEAIAVLDHPAYTYFKPVDSEVYCSKEMFESLDENTKLLAVIEESCVLSLERSIIPYGFKDNSREMFLFALQKVCTSITSGWFREYAWENYNQAVELYDQLDSQSANWYYSKFVTALILGKIKPYAN